jgi:hypothetical protein
MSNDVPLVLGCNYHTKWQSNKSMRFVLSRVVIESGKAELITRRTKSRFWTDISDLVFIDSGTNRRKADRLLNHDADSEYLHALLMQG